MNCYSGQETLLRQYKINYKSIFLSVALIGSFVFCYIYVFLDLVDAWWNISAYSHGFLVPFISIYLVWLKRASLARIKPSPAYIPGLLILFTGLITIIIGHAGGIRFLQEMALLVTITGIVLFVFGTGYLKALWFPIVYLMFMLTVWGTFIKGLHLPFQNFSANLGTKILIFLGIPAYRESIFIELPNITLEVAKVCSGVNYLVAVLAVGIPLARLTLGSWQRRVLLICGALIIAALSNGVRVALIGSVAFYGNGLGLHGPFHILQAMFVSVIGFFALFIGAWILSGKSDKSTAEPMSEIKDGDQKSFQHNVLQRAEVKNALIFTIGLLLIFGSYINFYKTTPVPLEKNGRWLPQKIGNWTFDAGVPIGSILSDVEFDKEINANYTNASGSVINLFVGYFENQEQGKELVNFQTEWLHDEAGSVKITTSEGKIYEINKRIYKNGKKNKLIYFWYEVGGRIAADQYSAKARTTLDSIIRGRSNGAIVLASRNIIKEQPETDELANTRQFVTDLLPALREFLP